MPWRDEHHWDLLGGAGGWELWGCDRCGIERFPSVRPFASMWRFRLWLNRCPAPSRRGRVPNVDLRHFDSSGGRHVA